MLSSKDCFLPSLTRFFAILERETSQIRAATDNGSKDNGPSAVSSVTGGSNVDTGMNATIKDEPTEESTMAQRRQSEKAVKRSNPHKYLLYRPTLSQLMVYLSTAFKVNVNTRYSE